MLDENKKIQLKASANALAYLVYGMCSRMDGFEAGVKAIEKSMCEKIRNEMQSIVNPTNSLLSF